jgi:hypothetical protein
MSWNRFMGHRPGPWWQSHGSMVASSMMTVGYKIDDPDLMTEPVWASSNPSRTSEIGQWRAVSPPGEATLGH